MNSAEKVNSRLNRISQWLDNARSDFNFLKDELRCDESLDIHYRCNQLKEKYGNLWVALGEIQGYVKMMELDINRKRIDFLRSKRETSSKPSAQHPSSV